MEDCTESDILFVSIEDVYRGKNIGKGYCHAIVHMQAGREARVHACKQTATKSADGYLKCHNISSSPHLSHTHYSNSVACRSLGLYPCVQSQCGKVFVKIHAAKLTHVMHAGRRRE